MLFRESKEILKVPGHHQFLNQIVQIKVIYKSTTTILEYGIGYMAAFADKWHLHS